MSVLQQYKCPCCDGAIAFDSTVQKMKCPYCDTEFEMEAISSYNEALNQTPAEDMSWNASENSQWAEGEEESLFGYVCKSCGGEIVADENTAATACPFCGNPVVMTGRVSGSLKPDFVIPFKVDRNAAKEALKQHYRGKKLLPKIFMDENHIDEIKGIYVPFWLFDTDADAHMRFRGTRIRHWSDSRYNYTETSYYSVVRGGRIGFNQVPVDGSSKMADDLMESIEPFDLGDAVDFETAYLAGYLADKYDVDSQVCIERANERIRQSTATAFASTVVGYSSLIPQGSSIRLHNGTIRYALLPVWLLNTNWNGQKYTFAMNGQTGKMVGNLPMDKSLFTKWLLGLTGAIGAACFALSYLVWML